jgi:AcrR family transcriptional regulator
MPRPIHADAEATRRRILERAVALFSDQGAGATSIRDIARAADVSLAMVHHYFGSKDGLYAACVDAMYAELAELRAHLEAALGRGGSVAELVERAVREGFRFARAHQTAVRLLMRSVVTAGELDEARQRDVQMPFLGKTSELIAALLARPAADLRLPIQSIVSLTARYALGTERELALVSGLGERYAGRAERAVEDHLVSVALAVLGLDATSSRKGKRHAN